MSGFKDNGSFELTRTRALYWHNQSGKRKCCKSLADVARTHISPAGFSWSFGTGGNFIVVRGPGLGEGRADDLFEAVSGRESITRDRPMYSDPAS